MEVFIIFQTDPIFIKNSGFQFKKWLTFNSNVNSSWKQEALNGDYEYVGMSKFDEPYFKRSYGGKDVFLSLWGPEGKRKWRIGPDVNTKGNFWHFEPGHVIVSQNSFYLGVEILLLIPHERLIFLFSLLVIYEKAFRKFWNSSQWMVSK